MIQVTPPDFMEKHPKCMNFWKATVRSESDPRCAICVLTLNGPNDETIEGDTVWDSVYIIEELQDLAKDAKGQNLESPGQCWSYHCAVSIGPSCNGTSWLKSRAFVHAMVQVQVCKAT